MTAARYVVSVLAMAAVVAGCASSPDASLPTTEDSSPRTAGNESLDSIDSVERAIRSGYLGPALAAQANATDDLSLVEIEAPELPWNVYNFFIVHTGYTVMVENGSLVLLCAGYGSGTVYGFEVQVIDGKEVLSYYFREGSSAMTLMQGHYVLGSGEPASRTWCEW